MQTFPIDYVRQLIEQTLQEEHIKDNKYFGGPNQVGLFSFYEHLVSEDEVNRYVEKYRDLSNQQNRTGLIMNGVILAPENPNITNIHSVYISPFTFTLQFRVKLNNRDEALETLNHLISVLRGRKHDIAELSSGKLFKVGTIANNVLGSPVVKNGDYIGTIGYNQTLIAGITAKLNALAALDTAITYTDSYPQYLYYTHRTQSGIEYLRCAVKKDNNSSWNRADEEEDTTIIIPPDETFTKYKLSVSFESIRCDQPNTLNGDEYCQISFGGSATLTSENVLLGNELTKVGIKKVKVVGATTTELTDTQNWLEPLELPSSNGADTQTLHLLSNKFITNSHTDANTISNQFSFILDKDNTFLMQLWKYARYGIQGNGTSVTYYEAISPNMVFNVVEIWSSWGVIEEYTYNARIIESIEIENTESDVLSITLPLQIQGDND